MHIPFQKEKMRTGVEAKENRRRMVIAVFCSLMATASVIATTVAVVLSQLTFL